MRERAVLDEICLGFSHTDALIFKNQVIFHPYVFKLQSYNSATLHLSQENSKLSSTFFFLSDFVKKIVNIIGFFY